MKSGKRVQRFHCPSDPLHYKHVLEVQPVNGGLGRGCETELWRFSFTARPTLSRDEVVSSPTQQDKII